VRRCGTGGGVECGIRVIHRRPIAEEVHVAREFVAGADNFLTLSAFDEIDGAPFLFDDCAASLLSE
jgi:hypothetical protein